MLPWSAATRGYAVLFYNMLPRLSPNNASAPIINNVKREMLTIAARIELIRRDVNAFQELKPDRVRTPL
jgi:hypothetical protein